MVDTIRLKKISNQLIGPISIVSEDTDVIIADAADEIDRLRLLVEQRDHELAEARKAAVPWRDGSEEPIEDEILLVHIHVNIGLLFGTYRRGNILTGSSEYDLSQVIRWCYESDVLPPATTNAPEGERGE